MVFYLFFIYIIRAKKAWWWREKQSQKIRLGEGEKGRAGVLSKISQPVSGHCVSFNEQGEMELNVAEKKRKGQKLGTDNKAFESEVGKNIQQHCRLSSQSLF